MDPLGRHEARWISQGTPTSLVRDQGTEGSDPVDAGIAIAGPIGSGHSTELFGEAANLRADDGVPASQFLRSKRRLGWLFLLFGLALSATGGYLLTHIDNVSSSRFTASAQLKNTLTSGSRVVGSSAFPECPGGGNPGAIPVDQIDISNPNEENFTIYSGNQIAIAQFSKYLPTDLFCIVGPSSSNPADIPNLGYDTLEAVRPGRPSSS